MRRPPEPLFFFPMQEADVAAAVEEVLNLAGEHRAPPELHDRAWQPSGAMGTLMQPRG